jgi:hypothetical protein
MAAVDLLEAVEPRDMRVVERRERFGFAVEAQGGEFFRV